MSSHAETRKSNEFIFSLTIKITWIHFLNTSKHHILLQQFIWFCCTKLTKNIDMYTESCNIQHKTSILLDYKYVRYMYTQCCNVQVHDSSLKFWRYFLVVIYLHLCTSQTWYWNPTEDDGFIFICLLLTFNGGHVSICYWFFLNFTPDEFFVI